MRTASASALYSVPEVSVTVPAGGSAQLQVRGMALQPGSAISSSAVSLSSQPMPANNVRMALYYGINWGYAESEPQQTALAVWYVQNGVWRDSSHATAEKIASAASSTTNTPSWTPAGKSVVQLAAQGQVTLSGITFAPLAQSPANGSGILTVSNSSAQDVAVYLPYGTVFGSGPGAALVWAVSAAAKSDAQPSATTAPATTGPSATTTTAATSEPVSQKSGPSPTATQEESAPPPPTQTNLPSKAPPVVPTATATNTATPLPSGTATNTPPPASATPTNTPVPPTTTATVQQAAQPAPEKSQPNGASSDAGSTNATNADSSGSANSAAKPGTQAGSSANAQNAQGAGSANSANGASAGNASKQSTSSGNVEASGQATGSSANGKASGQTDAIAPVIPTPITPSPTAAGRPGSAPPPVGTSQSSTQATTQPNPSPVGSAQATVGARGTNTPAPSTSSAAPTVTPALRSGSTPSATPGQVKPPPPVPSSQAAVSPSPSQQATVSSGQAATATRQVAPVEPTKLTDVAPNTPPVIDAGTDGGGSDGTGSGASASGSVQGTVTTPPVGPRPDSSPSTGAGPSPLPLVLSLSSVVLVLIGWQLRRLGRAQARSERSAS